MASFGIVKHLDIAEYFGSGFLSGNKYVFFDTLFFQGFKKALRNSIVIAVSSSTHAGNDVVLFEQTLPLVFYWQKCLIRWNPYGRYGTRKRCCSENRLLWSVRLMTYLPYLAPILAILPKRNSRLGVPVSLCTSAVPDTAARALEWMRTLPWVACKVRHGLF